MQSKHIFTSRSHILLKLFFHCVVPVWDADQPPCSFQGPLGCNFQILHNGQVYLPFHHHQDEHVDLNSVLLACMMLAGLSTPQSPLDVDNTVGDTWMFCRKWTPCSEIGTSGLLCLVKILRTAMHMTVQNFQQECCQWRVGCSKFSGMRKIHNPGWQWWMIPLSAEFPHMLVVNMMDNFQIGPWADLHKQETSSHDHSCEKKMSFLLRSINNLHGIKKNMYHTSSFPSLWFFFTWYFNVIIPL